MNFQNHPHSPPPRYNIDVAQKICISRTISLHNIIIQIFRHPQISPSLMKKNPYPPISSPTSFSKQNNNNNKKYLPKPLYLVPIYSLISHLQPFMSNIHTKVKVIYVLLALLPTTLHNMRRKKKTLSFTLLPLSLWFNRPIDDFRPPLTCPKPHRILCNIANTP